MLNQVVLVGRLVRDPELRETENKKHMSFVTLAVPRSFRNMNGEYETDFIDCVLWESVASTTVDYCHKGDIVGVKGRIQSRVIERPEGRRSVLEVVAERVTFLSSNKAVGKDTEEKDVNDLKIEVDEEEDPDLEDDLAS